MVSRKDFRALPVYRPDFELDERRTALVVVDMTYLDASPDHGLGVAVKSHPEMAAYYFGRLKEVVIPNHRKLIDFFHQHGLKVIYLTMGCWMPDKSDLPLIFGRLKKYFGCPGDKVSEVLEEIKPQPGDLVVHKTTVGAFNSTNLEHILRNLDISSLVITGVATSFCVETTARDAADRGFKVVLVEDACASHSQSMHDATLLAFSMMFGRVLSSEEVLGELEAQLRSSGKER